MLNTACILIFFSIVFFKQLIFMNMYAKRENFLQVYLEYFFHTGLAKIFFFEDEIDIKF